MFYKYCIVGCCSNYTAEEVNADFYFTKDEDIRERWIKFINRKDWLSTLSSYICKNHFEPKYFRKGQKNRRYRLIKKLKPVPTIFNRSYVTHMSSSSSNLISSVSIPRKSPRKRIFEEERYQTFLAGDLIKKLSEINENLARPGYSFQQTDDHVKFFKLVDNEMLLPEVTECIRIDKELHVKLSFKGSLVPLPQWFRHGRDCCLTHKNMLENFPAYLMSQTEKFGSIFEELREYKFKKRAVYSASVIRYTILLRYTSIQSYRILQKDFSLPSIPLLKKICSGAIDAVKCPRKMKDI